MAISVRNLTKRFKKFVAVDDVSFEIEDGESFALLGPNGSGKSTTLKCMAGLTLPSAGKVLIEGFDVLRNGREAKRQPDGKIDEIEERKSEAANGDGCGHHWFCPHHPPVLRGRDPKNEQCANQRADPACDLP